MAGKRIAATAGTVYSRDQPQRRYVQEALVEAAAKVRQWVAEGAAIYVCGSPRGMAPGVDAAMERNLGRGLVEELAADGRYRHDVSLTGTGPVLRHASQVPAPAIPANRPTTNPPTP